MIPAGAARENAVWKKGWKSRGHQSEGSSRQQFQGDTVGFYLTGPRWLVWQHSLCMMLRSVAEDRPRPLLGSPNSCK